MKKISFSILFVLFLIFPFSSVQSHEWYDLDCCDKRDCTVVTKFEEYGDYTRYYYNLFGRDDHIDVSAEWEKNNKKNVRPSKDSNHHVCVIYVQNPDGTRREEIKFIRCVYKPMMF